MLKLFYQRFLSANPGVQHYACHSHHYWPDVTRDAMLKYWDDSAKWVDDKWEHMFGETVPYVQRQISRVLNLKAPQQIVFAPNTHELLFRLLSCFDWSTPLKILTTDSEFHSFNLQVRRLSELATVEVVMVPTEPFTDVRERLIAAAEQTQPHLIFISQVFFNSGVCIGDLTTLVDALEQRSQATIVIDGYHGFMAMPTDLSALEGRIFYLAGSYKYAQGGEGCCFMVVPQQNTFRPLYTGWFAEFGTLSGERQDQVQYAEDGYRFAGATMDLSAMYRLRAVLSLYEEKAIGVRHIHQYIQRLQTQFLLELKRYNHPWLNEQTLLRHPSHEHGHFFTFRGPSAQAVAELAEALKRRAIHTDYRGDRLRFGFAPYLELDDIDLSVLRELTN